MKKIIFLLLISSSVLFGQNNILNIKGIDSEGNLNYSFNNKFIQVEVQDSIHLEKASSYDYLISIDKDIFPDNDTVYSINNIKEIKIYGSDYKKTKIAIEKIFKLRKLDYKYILYSSNSPYKLWYKDNYLVNVPSNKNLVNDFENELSQIKTIEQYRVINVHYKDEDKVEEILFEKLLKNAKKKASMIAELSGVKLGKIIEINEDTSNYIIQRRHYLFSNYYKVRAIKVKFSTE
jgi:hypothetical protein